MRAYIIAEAGVNHNGNLDLAFRLCEEAKKAGVDAVKFQTWKTENLFSTISFISRKKYPGCFFIPI